MSNSKMIVLASILGAILATIILALNPSMVGAQLYANEYGYDDSNYNNYHEQPKSSHEDIQKIKCVNSNINVNGIDITEIPEDTTSTAEANEGGAADASNSQNGNGWADKINFNRNLVNICVNVNVNEQVKVQPPPEEEPSPCENCFSILDDTEIQAVIDAASDRIEGNFQSLEQLCNFLEGTTIFRDLMDEILADAALSFGDTLSILQCLRDLGLIN